MGLPSGGGVGRGWRGGGVRGQMGLDGRGRRSFFRRSVVRRVWVCYPWWLLCLGLLCGRRRCARGRVRILTLWVGVVEAAIGLGETPL